MATLQSSMCQHLSPSTLYQVKVPSYSLPSPGTLSYKSSNIFFFLVLFSFYIIIRDVDNFLPQLYQHMKLESLRLVLLK